MWLVNLFSQLSRYSFRRSLLFIVISLSLLLMSWELQKVDAALLQTAIPDESIRLRILANSDSPHDQAIKMLVRDRIVEQMNGWAANATTLEDARSIVKSNLPKLSQAVADVLADNGQTYKYDIKLAEVDFPTKSYGSLVYPAGQYEALLITLGEAEGRNWWCVLFPPLCFVDTVSGEATVINAEKPVASEQVEVEITQLNEEEIEVEFFLVDAWHWVKGLFA